MKTARIVLAVLLTGWGCALASPPGPGTGSSPEAGPASPAPLDPTTSAGPPSSPPPAQFPNYQNTAFGFGLDLPPDAVFDYEEPSYIELDDFVHVDLTVTPGTTLVEKFFEITVVRGADPCLSPQLYHLDPPVYEAVFNDVHFLKQTGAGVAGGNIYQSTVYSTSRGGACISLIFVLHSIEPGNLITPPPVFDLAGESAIFDSIISTFTWLEP